MQNKGLGRTLTDKKNSDPTVRVEGANPDQVSERLREIIGDESVRKFAARHGLKAGTLQAAINAGSMRAETAAEIATAANVSLDWLILGRKPEDAPHIDEALLRDVIESVEEHLEANSVQLPTAKRALLIVQLYMIMIEEDEEVATSTDLISRFIRVAT